MDLEQNYDSDSGNECDNISSEEDVGIEFDSDNEGEGSSGACFNRDNEEFPYDVLSTEEVTKHMEDCITEFNIVANISKTTARLLLNHFNWDKEKLMERFYDSDQEKLFKEARVTNPATLEMKEEVITNAAGMEECHVCCLSLPPKMMFGLGCGHRFCTNCWREYITTRIIEEGAAQSVMCAGHNCKVVMEDQEVLDLLHDSKVKQKYQYRICQSFVECNRQLKWCPYPDCKYVVKAVYPGAKKVVCKCRHVFCFNCGASWHAPVKCSLLKLWTKKCDDDSETSNWISANTKECPKCKVTIEKDGGCNHMVCKNISCKSEFCWVCLGPWEPHGSSWYSCNRYDESEAKQARDSQEKSRAALQRYLFYYNRYMNHMQSLKFENKLYQSVKEKMEEMQQHNMSWIEVQFLQKAVDVLCDCRQTLMYTYVFAYYLEKNNQSVMFEDNQRDLEATTEKLSEYLERDITQENLASIKQRVQDKYRYCEQRCKKLLEHVHEGYEKEWWTYRFSV